MSSSFKVAVAEGNESPIAFTIEDSTPSLETLLTQLEAHCQVPEHYTVWWKDVDLGEIPVLSAGEIEYALIQERAQGGVVNLLIRKADASQSQVRTKRLYLLALPCEQWLFQAPFNFVFPVIL